MENKRWRLLATIDGVIQMADTRPDVMSVPKVAGTVDKLRAIRAVIEERLERERVGKGPTRRAAQITAWCDNLREEHLLVIQSTAEFHLTDESGRPMKLKVPHRTAPVDAVLACAKEFETKLRPRLQELIEQKVGRDILDAMNDAAAQLEAYRSSAPKGSKGQKALEQEIAALIAEGRRGVKLIRRVLAPTLREDPVFKSQLIDAITASVKPGPPKERSSTSQQEKSERAAKRRRKRTHVRPLPFESTAWADGPERVDGPNPSM